MSSQGSAVREKGEGRNGTTVDQHRGTCGDKKGTLTGYNRHRRAGEDVCVWCREAMRTYNRERTDARKKRGPWTSGRPIINTLPKVDDEWKDHAACYGEDFINTLVIVQLQTCGVCRVVKECDAYAQAFADAAFPVEGVWGGEVWQTNGTVSWRTSDERP